MNISITNQAKCDVFAALFQHMKLFTEHINIMFEPTRVYIQTMDSSHVSIIEIHLPASWFDTYELTSESGITIGVNSTLLYRILNIREKGQEISIKYDLEDSDRLFIHFTCDNKDIFDKQFELPLLDLDVVTMNIPAIDSQAEITISSANLANIIGQMKQFGDALEITCTEENVQLYALSTESGKMAVDINIDDLTAYSINEGQSMNLSFSLNILHNMCLHHKLAKTVDLFLTDNYPMKLDYNLGEENAHMTFYLAPKIKDDA
jgi:proliferating cell nuclear antigen